MIFSLVNKTINSLSTGYQKHTSHGRDAEFIAATTGTYLCLCSQRWDQTCTGASAWPAAPCAGDPASGVKSPPTLHHPTSSGMLSPTEHPASPLPLQLGGQRQLRNVPLPVLTAYCTSEPGWVGDCPQACQPNDPHDTKVRQSRAADRCSAP